MPPLEKQTVPAVFSAGLDTSKDPKIVSQGLLRIHNGVFDREGEIKKRFGMTNLTGAHNERFISKFQERPVIFDDANVGSFKVFDGAAYNSGDFDAVDSMRLADVGVTKLDTMNKIPYACYARAGNIYAVAYEEWYDNIGGVVHYYHIRTYDTITNALLDSTTTSDFGLAQDAGIRVIYSGFAMYYFFVNAANELRYKTINTATGVIDKAHVAHPSGGIFNSTVPIDVCNYDDTDKTILIASAGAAGVAGDALATYLNTRTGAIASTNFVQANCQAVGCYKQVTGTAIMIYYDGAAAPHTVKVRGLSITLATTIAETQVWAHAADTVITVTGAKLTDTTSIVYINIQYNTLAGGGEHTDGCYSVTFDTTGPAAGIAALLAVGMTFAAKPLYHGSNNYHLLILYHADVGDDQKCFYIVEANSSGVAGSGGRITGVRGRFLQGYAQTNVRHAARSEAISNDQWLLTLSHRSIHLSEDVYGVALIDLSIAISGVEWPSIKTVENQTHLVIPNSCPWEFDGRQVIEQGFPFYPWNVKTAAAAGAGLGSGSYGYKAIFEWYDKQGNRHRSAPSPASSVTTTTGNNKVLIHIPTMTMSKRTDIRIVVYRTVVDGSIYYRLRDVANVYASQHVTWTDSTADATITGNEQLYTRGGVLENIQPMPYKITCIHQNRQFYVPSEYANSRIYYSQEFLPNTCIEHSDYLVINVDPEGGDITALASFQDRLIIFKAHSIYGSYGTGYDARGTGQNYSIPQLVSPAIGCIDQKSIVLTPLGLMFLSANGIYLLDSTLQPKPIGEPAKYQVETQTFKAAVAIPELNHVVFMFNDGNALVFNYLHGQWSTYTNHLTQDAVRSGGYLYRKVVSSTTIAVEDRSTFLDNGVSVSMLIETGWFPFAGLLGHKRVYKILLMMQNVHYHQLRVKVAYDFNPAWIDEQTYESDALSTFAASAYYGAGMAVRAYLLDVRLSQEKCTAIRLHISDEVLAAPATIDEGFTLTAVAFEVGIKRGLMKLGAVRKV